MYPRLFQIGLIMFDSPSCSRQISQFPLFINGGIVINMMLTAILILAFLGVRWLIKRSRWKQRLFNPKIILLLIGLGSVLALMFFTVRDALFLPTDPGTPAQAIVVLGRGQPLRKQRVDLAVQLWQAKRSPIVFASGIGDTPEILSMLKQRDIPLRALDGENCSLVTSENALFTAAILKSQGIKKIILITDPPHMWRSLLEFRATGLAVIPRTSPLPSNWSFIQKAFLTVRECIFLFQLGLQKLFYPQQPPRANNPELKILLKKVKEYSLNKQ